MADPPDKHGLNADEAEEGQRLAKRIHNTKDFGDLVNVDIDIIVGPANPSYPVHANYRWYNESFCKRSRAYPLAVLGARSNESIVFDSGIIPGRVGKIVRLPNVRVEVFKVYFAWSNSGIFRKTRRCTQESGLDAKHAEHMLFIDLYRLGCSTLEDTTLRNAAALELSTTLEACDVLPDSNAFAAVWSIKLHGDRLRRLLVEFVIAKVDPEDLGVPPQHGSLEARTTSSLKGQKSRNTTHFAKIMQLVFNRSMLELQSHWRGSKSSGEGEGNEVDIHGVVTKIARESMIIL